MFVVNAQSIQRMAGRKTDMTDAEWIATLMQHGLLQHSFILDRAHCELRDLSRYRLRLIQERTRFANRLQKVLEGTNLKLSAVVSDRQGVSAQAILRQLSIGRPMSRWRVRPTRMSWPSWRRRRCGANGPNWNGPWWARSRRISAISSPTC